MFERMLLENAANGRRRPWTVAVSVLLQSLLVGVLALIPLFHTEAITCRLWVTLLEPPAGPPRSATSVSRPLASVKPPWSLFAQGRLLAPSRIPDDVSAIVDAIPPEAPVIGDGPLGPHRGLPFGSGTNWIANSIGPRPVGPAPNLPSQRPAAKITVGGDVQQAKLMSQPKPVYPMLAKQARISGTVRLAAIISEAGTIEELRVLQGHPLLVQAAMEAVQQWRYRPTFLNGSPVKVDTTIDVIFTLSQ